MMKLNIIILMCLLVSPAFASTISYPLNYPNTFNDDNPYWTHDFNLNTVFTNITECSIYWRGEAIAGTYLSPSGTYMYLDSGIYITLKSPVSYRMSVIDISAGQNTYPNPEYFDITEAFNHMSSTLISELLSGQGTISIELNSYVFMDNTVCINRGTIILEEAQLIVEGDIVPEPISLLLLPFGILYRKLNYESLYQ